MPIHNMTSSTEISRYWVPLLYFLSMKQRHTQTQTTVFVTDACPSKEINVRDGSPQEYVHQWSWRCSQPRTDDTAALTSVRVSYLQHIANKHQYDKTRLSTVQTIVKILNSLTEYECEKDTQFINWIRMWKRHKHVGLEQQYTYRL